MDTRYRVSVGAVYSLKYHLVWCPKYRLKVLVGPVEKRLRQLLYQKAKELEADIQALEIMPDHVHMFVESDPRLAPAHIAAQFKGFTSHELREEFPWLKSRMPALWSRSYYVGSIGTVSESTVRRYIANQKTRAQNI
jgi:putative transposase